MTLGKIYKIINNVDEKIYIGSTKCKLCRRMGEHRSLSNTKPDRKLYQHFQQVGLENFQIVLIENYHYETKEELRSREQFWINELKPELNIRGATFDVEKRKEYHKQYGKTDKVKKYKKERNKLLHICECGMSGLIVNKTRHEKSKQHLEFQSLLDWIYS